MKKDFKMFILSRVKFAKKRLNHDRRTHFGLANKKRSVAEDFCMTDLRHQNRGNAPESHMELGERREQIERAIRRFTSRPHWRERKTA